MLPDTNIKHDPKHVSDEETPDEEALHVLWAQQEALSSMIAHRSTK